MKIIDTKIADVKIIEPQVFGDDRGFFFESYNESKWRETTGLATKFVQENHSRSAKNVLRGLHYQIRQAQAKLVRVIVGEVYDVAVDIRKSSGTFGQWVGVHLSAENKRQLWIPEGFAHGFVVVSEHAELLYLTTNFYAPEHDRSIIWNDNDLNIKWPVTGPPLLSAKDEDALAFREAEVFE